MLQTTRLRGVSLLPRVFAGEFSFAGKPDFDRAIQIVSKPVVLFAAPPAVRPGKSAGGRDRLSLFNIRETGVIRVLSIIVSSSRALYEHERPVARKSRCRRDCHDGIGTLKICEQAPAGSTVLCMLPDTGERYLSTPLFADVAVEMTDKELKISVSTPGYHVEAAG